MWADAFPLPPRLPRLRKAARAVAVLVVLSVPWLVAVPAALWRGIVVVEPCARELARGGTFLGSQLDDVRFSWVPPGWRCRSVDGHTALLPPWGGAAR